VKDIARAIVPHGEWEQLRRWRPRWVQDRFAERQITARFLSYDLTLNIADPMSLDWYSPGNDTLPEVVLLTEGKLKPGARVFDLGVHQGVVALVLAKVVGEGGEVLAVEANPFHAKMAEKNARSNSAANLKVALCAVSDGPGTLKFSDDWGGQHPDAHGVEVEMFSLDALSEKYEMPDVLFIDVEGFELKVLEGGPKTMGSGPDLFIEMHLDGQLQEQGGSLEKILAHLPESRYELLALDPETHHQPGGMKPVPVAGADFTGRRFYLIARTRN
jgi:FkbM family methyltransferase